MPIKAAAPPSFTTYYVEQRKTKRVFLKQIAQLIHWEVVTHVLEKYYPTGQSGQGRKAYPADRALQDDFTTDLVPSHDYGLWYRRTSPWRPKSEKMNDYKG